MDALKSNFEGYETEKMELSETAKEIVYEFSIEKGETEKEVVIDVNGTIVKKNKRIKMKKINWSL